MARRRLTAVAAASLLALGALTGCRVEAGSAAYVGGHRITVARVDAIVDGVKGHVPAGATGDIRQSVLSWLVVTDAAGRYAAAHQIKVQPIDPVALARQRGLPADVQSSEYTRVYADLTSVMTALQSVAPSTPPTEADQREAYAYAAVPGQSAPFEQVRSLFSQDAMGKPVGLRDLLRSIVKQSDITISPRYGQVVFQVPVTIGQVSTHLGVLLDTTPATPPVVDAR